MKTTPTQAHSGIGASVAAVLGLIGSLAQAAPVAISNAAYAHAVVRDCRSTLARVAGSSVPDRCEATGNFTDTVVETQSRTTLGGFTAAVGATNPIAGARGTPTQSAIDASGAAGVLQLHQGAFAGSYARVSGHSLGLQSFYYDGTGPSTRTIHSELDFTSNVTPNAVLETPGVFGAWTDPAVYAKTRVTVFSLTESSFLFNSETLIEPQIAGFWSQAQVQAGYRLEGQSNVNGIRSSGTPTDVSFELEVGRYYFVESYLGLWARFGGELDATHTFTSTIGTLSSSGDFMADVSGFAAAAQLATPVVIGFSEGTVPEPGTAALALAALALLGLRRRAAAKSRA